MRPARAGCSSERRPKTMKHTIEYLDHVEVDQITNLVEQLISVNRCAAVVKGGRRFSFGALVVVGDGRGRVGYGTGKAREVPEAIRKATEQAKRNMMRVPLRDGRTLHHDIEGRHGAGRVVMRTAVPGTGIIAGKAVRKILELAGIRDILTKNYGSTNALNVTKATLTALSQLRTKETIERLRGVTLDQAE